MFDANILTFEQAHDRYRRLRLISYDEAMRAAHEVGFDPQCFTEIDAAALHAWRAELAK